MNNMENIKRICELPVDFKHQNKSAFQLAKESGFTNENKGLTIAKIKEYLQDHISLIDLWEIWSQDKRTTEGFYLKIGNRNIVGYYGSTYKREEINYKSAIEACSEFIFLEISCILNLTIYE
jgi:hypothetical protein